MVDSSKNTTEAKRLRALTISRLRGVKVPVDIDP